MFNFVRIYGAKADAQGFYRQQAPYLKLTSERATSERATSERAERII